MSDGRQAGKVAVVTGGAGGIGGATARRLSREGAEVVVVDVDVERAEQVAAEVAGLPVAADVAREDDVERYLAAAVERFGRVDLHHLNAGIPGTLAGGYNAARVLCEELHVERWWTDPPFVQAARDAGLLPEPALIH